MSKKAKAPSFERRLKKFSIAEIEEVIARAISDLVGDEYDVEIERINFGADNMGFISDRHEIKLSIERRSSSDEDIPF